MLGKAPFYDDLESGELLVWFYKMILTVDEKHPKYCFVIRTVVLSADTIVFCNPTNANISLYRKRKGTVVLNGSFFLVLK